MRSTTRFAIVAVAATLAVTALAGCTPTVPLTPAAHATDPKCAEIIVRLPTSLGDDLPIRQTNAQATGAWGSPAAVLLRCGVTPPGPTTDVCYTLGGIDWLIDSKKKPIYVFTTFGRNPATEVIVDSRLASGTTSLDELSNAVGTIKQTKECLNREDVLGSTELDSPSPTPAPSTSPTP